MPSLNSLKNVKQMEIQVPFELTKKIQSLFTDAVDIQTKAAGLFSNIIQQTTVIENMDGKTFESWVDQSLIDFGDAPKENDTWSKYVSLIKWGLDNA